MTCRAAGASTCTNATPTGQALGYDALRRLISWQNASRNPTATGAYDGSGSRVWQQDTVHSRRSYPIPLTIHLCDSKLVPLTRRQSAPLAP
jgi:hypothetical protein